MSAAPRSTPDIDPPAEAGQGDADGWALLESLRRRIDDQATQGRKTQQQVSQLADSIGALVDVQRRRSRWLNLNSFIAYLIFTILCGAGFYMLYRTRANELVEARDSAQRERDLAVRRADTATARATAREQADARAWEVYQLLEAGKRSEATGKLEALGDLPLSRTERAVLAARAHETQVIEVDLALKAAAASFKRGRHGEVIAPLEAALVGEPAGTRAASMRYYLGIAYAKTNQLDKAIVHLTVAAASASAHDDARFQLASALDRSGHYAKARGEYDRFATAHPQSHLAVFAMRRSATLARMPARAAAPKAGAPKTAAPKAGAPAPRPATSGPASSKIQPKAIVPARPPVSPRPKASPPGETPAEPPAEPPPASESPPAAPAQSTP